MPPPAHLISKIGDPLFAVFIGLSAAVTRINREEKELGHSTKETLDAGFRYVLIFHPLLVASGIGTRKDGAVRKLKDREEFRLILIDDWDYRDQEIRK